MNRREASKHETRQIILTAARELFAKKGMEECTIRDIARKAGVSPASVVVHFKCKTALLEEALYIDIEKALSKLVATIPEGLNLEDRLMYFFKGFLEFYDKNRNLYRALLASTIFEPSDETPVLTKQSEQYVRFIFDMIEEQKVYGVVRNEVDSMVAASSIFFLYIGALILFFRMQETTVEQTTDFLRSMVKQYIKSIITPVPLNS